MAAGQGDTMSVISEAPSMMSKADKHLGMM